MSTQFKVFSIFSPLCLSTGLWASKAPCQCMACVRGIWGGLWEQKLWVQHGPQEGCPFQLYPKPEGGRGRWREGRNCIFDPIRAQVYRAKAQRSEEAIQGAQASEFPHLGSNAQTHPCLPLCRNLTSVFLSLALVVLTGKTEDLTLVPCGSNIPWWFSQQGDEQETELSWAVDQTGLCLRSWLW